VISDADFTGRMPFLALNQQDNRTHQTSSPVLNSRYVAYLLVFIVEQNLVGILAVTLLVFYRRLGLHITRHKATE